MLGILYDKGHQMKIAVVMATFNKNAELPNTLFSLNRQKTTHDIEVCIVDDRSDVDPKPIIDKFLTKFPVKYKRLDERAGVQFSHGMAFDMISDDVEVVLQPSSDVIYSQDTILHDLCIAVEDKMPAFVEVLDIPVDPTMYKDFDSGIKYYLDNWHTWPTRIDVELNGILYKNCSTVYSGRPECSWLFFMGAMTAKNFEDIGFRYLACDAYMHPVMRELGFKSKLLPWLKGIHQRHHKEMYKCNLLDHCPYWCIQKDWAKA